MKIFQCHTILESVSIPHIKDLRVTTSSWNEIWVWKLISVTNCGYNGSMFILYMSQIYIYIYITCDSIIINCSLLVLIADYIAVMTQLNMLNISIIWSLHLAV